MKRRPLVYISLLCLLLLLITGCWSSTEIEDLTILSVVGMDLVNVDGQKMIKISNLAYASGNNTQTQESGRKDELETILSYTGESIQEQYKYRIPKYTYQNISLLIFGEEYARVLGIRSIMDAVLSYPVGGLTASIAIAKGQAYDILNSKPELAKTISKELDDKIKVQLQKKGLSKELWNIGVFEDLVSQDKSAVILGLETVKHSDPNITNISQGAPGLLAVFRKDKLVGWLDEEEAIGYFLIQGRIAGIPLVIKEDNNFVIPYILTKVKTKITPKVEGDKVSFKVDIKTEGQVINDAMTNATINTDELKHFEDLITEKIRTLAETAVQKGKDYNSDFLGFGYRLHRTNPTDWKRFEPDWENYFSNSDIEFSVESKITSSGKSSKSLPF